KVEILTAKRGGPSRDWLNENLGYVKTVRARRKIKHWFKKQNYQISLSEGRSILERELKRLNITDVKYEDLAEACNYKKTDDFLAALGYDDLSIHHVIRKTLELSAAARKEEAEAPPSLSPPSTPVSGNVTVMGVGDLYTTLARCCNPVNGDPIIGYITRGRGVTIHRKDCANILKQTDKERLIQVGWGTPIEKQTHPVPIVISAFDRSGLIRDVSDIIANEQLNLTDIKVTIKNNIASVWLTIEVADLYELRKIMDKIEQLNNVIEVSRRR
ncbi:MAG TPA: bifunctional (p)ppGpp synthetase/guanosine-3',5'-bis(diphosphate) 3'-pyrophosphohydrolase, partial [Anaerolineae bacterium]|nr:bifunctional (p)ppGpp synthetase/guanosine-3',5'-bis(diphosphate) 3'-pyrophosphohydrolase [Anaerolineae bacterium]